MDFCCTLRIYNFSFYERKSYAVGAGGSGCSGWGRFFIVAQSPDWKKNHEFSTWNLSGSTMRICSYKYTTSARTF